MSLVAPYSPDGAVASQAGMKPFSTVRAFGATHPNPETDRILTIKYNPDWDQGTTPGAVVASAQVEVTGANIVLDVDGPAERSIAWSGLTAQQLVDAVNAPNADGSRYWRAGVGDVQPESVNNLEVLAAKDALLGYKNSVLISHASAAFVYCSNGYDDSEKGAGDKTPQPFDTDYAYGIQSAPGTPVTTVGRGGGISARQGEDILPQKASRFGSSNIAIAKERHPANHVFETIVQSVGQNLTFAVAEAIRISIYEDGTGLVWAGTMAIGETELVVPDVKVKGPARVSANGVTFANFTSGKLVVRGLQRVA